LYLKMVQALAVRSFAFMAQIYGIQAPLKGNCLIAWGVGASASPHGSPVLFALPQEADYLEVTGVVAGDIGTGLEGPRVLRKGPRHCEYPVHGKIWVTRSPAAVDNVAGKVVGGHEGMHQRGESGSGMPRWWVATRAFAPKESEK
jgi:hypothetical protein